VQILEHGQGAFTMGQWVIILNMNKSLFALSLLVLPVVSHAQSLQDLVKNTTSFLGEIVIPFLIGIAFLAFVYNVIRFFVLGSTSEEGREKAKALAIYSVLAFTLIIIFWGIINLLTSSIGLDDKNQPGSDYVPGDFKLGE